MDDGLLQLERPEQSLVVLNTGSRAVLRLDGILRDEEPGSCRAGLVHLLLRGSRAICSLFDLAHADVLGERGRSVRGILT